MCSASCVLCPFSCISGTILHGAGVIGQWFVNQRPRWGKSEHAHWFYCRSHQPSGWRCLCAAPSTTEGQCEESDVLLLKNVVRGLRQQSNVLVTDIVRSDLEGDWPPDGLSEDIPLCRFCVIFLAYLWILSAHILLEAGWTFRFQNFEPNVLYQCHRETLITEALIQQSILSRSWHTPYVFVRSLAFWWSTSSIG